MKEMYGSDKQKNRQENGKPLVNQRRIINKTSMKSRLINFENYNQRSELEN